MRRRPEVMYVSALLGVALAIAGCGGGGDATATAEISKPAFLKRANAICAENYENNKSGFEAFTRKAKGEPFSTDEEIREFAHTVLVANKQREIRELRALGAPSGDEEEVEALLAAYEEGIATAEENPWAAVKSASGAFATATELAEAYGLEKCRY